MNTDPSRVTAPPWTAHPPAVRSPCGAQVAPDQVRMNRIGRAWRASTGAVSPTRRAAASPTAAGGGGGSDPSCWPAGLLSPSSPSRSRVPQPRREDRAQGGYVTLFVLAIAAVIFLALGSALQANSCLRDANRRQAQQLQARAAEIAVRPQ
jgi:heme exporter protein D